METNVIYNEDCIEGMKEKIPDESIDLIVTDPPYNIGKDEWDKIDNYIEWCGKWIKQCERVLKYSGSFYFFHNDINSVIDILNYIKTKTSFKIRNQITWHKLNNWKSANINDGAGMYRSLLQCYGNQRKYNGSTTEYLYFMTFADVSDESINDFKKLRNYFKRIQKEFLQTTKKNIIEKVGHCADHCFRWGSSQWSLPTKKTYKKLIEIFNINQFDEFRKYKDLKNEYKNKRYVFNQPKKSFKGKSVNEIKKYLRPYSTVWEFERGDIYNNISHLTPKPLNMIEHIIKTSSNEGGIVLDCFGGSGTTAKACQNLNRKYTLFEKKQEYAEISRERLKRQSLFSQAN